MTEPTLISLAGQYGPWFAMAIMLIYIVANKLGPQWLSSWFEERKLVRQAEVNVYERFIAQQAETLRFIGSAANAMNSMNENITRSLDGNTQQIYHLTQAVDRGGRCPLPDCPYISKD